jgi:UAA transporter family.
MKPTTLSFSLYYIPTDAFTYFAAMTASNEALGYVSYPTAVLAKSSKLIPTMIVGSLVERKLFKLQDWCSALLITGGIAIFNLSRLSSKKNHHVVKPSHDVDDDSSDSDSIFGIFLLILSLAMDGLLSSCQESLKRSNNYKGKKYRIPSALESMLWVNAYAILFMLPLSLCNGQFANGCKLLSMGLLSHTTRKTPSLHADSPESFSLTWSIVLLNLTAAAGQIFIFFTIALFSPLTCTTITTTRKFCTILLSVWKFGHVVTPLQWMAIGMVFGGIYLAILSKFTSSSKTKKNKAKKEVGLFFFVGDY